MVLYAIVFSGMLSCLYGNKPTLQVITNRRDPFLEVGWFNILVLLLLVWSEDWSPVDFVYKQVRSGRN